MITHTKHTPLLSLEGIEKVYPNGFHAVHSLNLTIGRGEFLTLLGPSGCGKTSTLRMVGGFELPSSGVIFLDGEDITTLPPNARAVNTVFQDYALFPHMTIAQNVAFGPTIARRGRTDIAREVSELLATVGLKDKANLYPGQLSGGQRQRVALARALIQKPRLLLLDEPLGALDANMREQMQMELKALQTQLGITFVMVTHDQQEALMLSDRIAIMDAGRLVQVGSPRALYETPATQFVADFLGTCTTFSGKILEKSSMGTVVDCGGQPLCLPARDVPGGLNETVILGIRPEKCALSLTASAAEGFQVPAVVEKVIFLGNLMHLHLSTPFCADFVVESRETDIKAGDACALSFDPKDVMMFPPQAA
ncbi:MAG: ABC transporter ATP-binding protein [Acetobacter sp.]|uniref:ABC transporter ATP-binding protein n=1 Tax=Acetobacter sp. TaxID=440 RepID=UPI003CFDE9BE